ncbi:MAG: STAS domain-containing protein [Treponema sp.]|nr:STAS domain-containing protein [Treponema sp.]
MEMKLSKNDDNIYHLALSGYMDLCSANQLKEIILKVIKNNVEQFIISLNDVTSISSAGIGSLVWVFSTLKKLGCPLIIIANEGIVMQALEATRIKGYFTIAASMKEALALAAATRKELAQAVPG